MECSRCPYSQKIIDGKIEINPMATGTSYCEKEFPQECLIYGRPRELDNK